MENVGTVLEPIHYRGWRAELTGDTADTGGIYVHLFPPERGRKTVCFWDMGVAEVLRQLEAEAVRIRWEKALEGGPGEQKI